MTRKQVRSYLCIGLLTLLLGGCAGSVEKPLPIAPPERPSSHDLQRLQATKSTFKDVRPILERRCVVCHGCYDAPCQLKLSSHEGVKRGASPIRVYDKGRFTWQQPTRLFIDANRTDQWRQKGFHPVVPDSPQSTAQNNLQNSLLYQMLRLKRQHPLQAGSALPSDIDLSIDRDQRCPRIDQFAGFAARHPDWGMPFALPELSSAEYEALVRWIAGGASAAEVWKPDSALSARISRWEAFFNQPSRKAQLVSRYIYEHLLLGHLHFSGTGRHYFRLVRSRSESGPVDEIATVRPYDDPGGRFYYRLRPYTASIVDKSHIVYELSDARMQRYRQLFFSDDYTVTEHPPYHPGEAAEWSDRMVDRMRRWVGLERNHLLTPFRVFEAIPVEARYRFLLDDARFFINGFIKGPVCRGIGALSSIEDHFWVFFLSPDNPQGMVQHGLNGRFLRENDNLLHLPTEIGNTNMLLKAWRDYWPKEQDYMRAKLDYYQQQGGDKFPMSIDAAIRQFVWRGVNGDGSINANAALTVFRNLDSAAVHHGLIGDEPETAWMIDYPIFERLHYLLVAGYNTFGTLGHQAAARLYMDFLRMEGEDTFLFFLPADQRKALYQRWHGVDRITTPQQRKTLASAWLNAESVGGYASFDPQHELYEKLRSFVVAKSPDERDLNRCNWSNCFSTAHERAMQRLANLSGRTSRSMPLQFFPALSLIRIDGRYAYSLIYNKSYHTYEKDSFIKKVLKRSARDMRGDTVTVVPGVAGAFPNLFFDLKSSELATFVAACETVRSEYDFIQLVNRYGVRRTNPEFWTVSDWFQDYHAKSLPIEAGILDLSRYSHL